MVKNPVQETRIRSLGWEDPLEKGMATHSSILAWRIPIDRGTWQAAVHGVEKSQHMIFWGFPGGTTGKKPICQRRRHKGYRFDPWIGKISWRRAWQPTPVFLPGKSHGQRSLAGSVHGVAKSQTRLSTPHSCRWSKASFVTYVRNDCVMCLTVHPWDQVF